MDFPKDQVSLETENKEHGAATSKLNSSNPVNSHNMNDLKMIDFNSADEVRQAMKAILAANKPQNSGDEIKPQSSKERDVKSSVKSRANSTHNVPKTAHVFKIVDSKEERVFSSKVRKKRPGRPPNAGPSKRMKKISVTNLFIGKLTNVVQFKHYASESESDDYFY